MGQLPKYKNFGYKLASIWQKTTFSRVRLGMGALHRNVGFIARSEWAVSSYIVLRCLYHIRTDRVVTSAIFCRFTDDI